MSIVGGLVTINAGTFLPNQMQQVVAVVRKATEYMHGRRLPYQTAFVLAYLDQRANYNLQVLRLSDGFVKAIHNYVWHNDASNLTKALQITCDKAMAAMCKVEVKFEEK